MSKLQESIEPFKIKDHSIHTIFFGPGKNLETQSFGFLVACTITHLCRSLETSASIAFTYVLNKFI